MQPRYRQLGHSEQGAGSVPAALRAELGSQRSTLGPRCRRAGAPGPAEPAGGGRGPRAGPGGETRPQAADRLPRDITQSAAPPDWLNSSLPVHYGSCSLLPASRLLRCALGPYVSRYPPRGGPAHPGSPRPGGGLPNRRAARACGGR